MIFPPSAPMTVLTNVAFASSPRLSHLWVDVFVHLATYQMWSSGDKCYFGRTQIATQFLQMLYFYFYTFKLVFSVRVKAILPIIFFFRLASNALSDFGGRSDDAKGGMAPCKGFRNSGNFCLGNPESKKFMLWNVECWALES